LTAEVSPKPSARAITERFVKLRQLAGIKVSITPGGVTPGKGRARVSKYTTPKKRKNKDSSDESDADEHLTENESPTKKQSLQRSSGGPGRGRGMARGGGLGGRVGTPRHASSPMTRIKSGTCTKVFVNHKLTVTEYPLSELPVDPLDTFQRDAAEAAELRQTSQQNPFSGFTSSGMGGIASGDFHGFDASNNHTTFNNGFTSPGMALDDPFTAPNHSNHGFFNDMHAFANGMQAAVGNSYAPVGTNVSRSKSARAASALASKGVATVFHRQKDQDELDGEKSSGEDSQASEYHDLDSEYV
jgi:hypothetical protein